MLQYVPRERTKEFSGVAWPGMDSRGCYNVSISHEGTTRIPSSTKNTLI
jgi:hypothetical protein